MEKEKTLHKPMSKAFKRMLFFSLLLVFIVYTIILAGRSTEFTKGKEAFTREAREGKLLFQNYNCISCHQVYGLGGYMGPDLTNVISGRGKDEIYLKAILRHGTKRMPDFNLSEAEITALTDYLKYLDRTGVSPVSEFTLSAFGTASTLSHEEQN